MQPCGINPQVVSHLQVSSINRVLRGLFNEAQKKIQEVALPPQPPPPPAHPYVMPPNLRAPMADNLSQLEALYSAGCNQQTAMYNRLNQFLQPGAWSSWYGNALPLPAHYQPPSTPYEANGAAQQTQLHAPPAAKVPRIDPTLQQNNATSPPNRTVYQGGHCLIIPIPELCIALEWLLEE